MTTHNELKVGQKAEQKFEFFCLMHIYSSDEHRHEMCVLHTHTDGSEAFTLKDILSLARGGARSKKPQVSLILIGRGRYRLANHRVFHWKTGTSRV